MIGRRAALVGLGLLLAAPRARAEEPAAAKTVLSGGWAAVAGQRPFQGSWTAEVTAATPDAAQGTWAMVDAQGTVVMQGTWSANKAKGWRGAWSARIAPGGDIISGTWAADASALKGCKTFVDMLRRGSQTQISGTWRAGSARGTWWLRPLPQASS